MVCDRGFDWKYIIALAVVVIFYFAGSLILVNKSGIFISPDETANAYFSNLFSEQWSFVGATDELSAKLDDRLHPRSVVSNNGVLLPGSFLGLPAIFGAVASVLGSWTFWILTPLFTVLAAWGWKKIIDKYTTVQLGTLSSVLFLLHPVVMYYSARGLMHNVLFVDLLVVSAWLWICRPIQISQKHCSIINDLLAGLILGFALFVRSSEVLWITAALALACACSRRYFSWRRIRAGVLGLIIGLAVLFGTNTLTYGSPFQTGYTVSQASVSNYEANGLVDSFSALPFGFHPRDAWTNFSEYGIEMFWWLSVLAVIGFFILFGQKRNRKDLRCGILIVVLISVWLVLMYGSWEIHDNPDPTQITMANSYVRYWLPIYLFSTPMIAAAILWIAGRVRSLFMRRLSASVIILLVIGFNVHATFLQGQDGLILMRQQLLRSEEIQEAVLSFVPTDAVLIVDRADKLFFPHRRVLYPLRDDTTYEAMPTIANETPLYYYGITLPKADIDYLNESRLGRMELKIEFIEQYDDESLYRIIEK